MTTSEKKRRIENVVAHYHRIAALQKALHDYIPSPESAIWTSMWRTFQALTNATSALVGDREAWIDWFIWENRCGEAGFSAKPEGGGHRCIRDVDDLIALIDADTPDGCGGSPESDANPENDPEWRRKKIGP